MTNAAAPVSLLVIDSGVGGLSITEHISKDRPDIQLIYLADFEAYPYGEMGDGELLDRVILLVSRALKKHNPDAVLLACNTLSTLALPILRERFDLPFIGVVPAIKPAAVQSASQALALIATPATIERPYTQDLIRTFAPDCHVLRIGSTELVSIAEQKLIGIHPDLKAIAEIFQPIHAFNSSHERPIDTVVLGCTHFPLLLAELEQAYPDLNWLDSGAAIASRVNTLLPAKSAGPVRHFFYSTQERDLVVLTPQLDRLGLPNAQLSLF